MIASSEIARYLGKDLIGEDIEVAFPRFIENAEESSVVFVINNAEAICVRLNALKHVLVIACLEIGSKLVTSRILSDNPRLDFTKVFRRFWPERIRPPSISPTAIIGNDVELGADVSIGHYTVIGDHVRVGEGTSISHHCYITGDTHIGSHCRIESHCAIGQAGWWFTRDENGGFLDLPHHGKVIIHDHVHIGSFTDIDRGLLPITDTVISSHVRINDKVHIGHGARISEGARIAVAASISGETRIGRNCWIGPASVIAHSLSICDNVTIGMNSTVVESITEEGTYFGTPVRNYGTLLKKL